jgi:hypothetical protein
MRPGPSAASTTESEVIEVEPSERRRGGAQIVDGHGITSLLCRMIVSPISARATIRRLGYRPSTGPKSRTTQRPEHPFVAAVGTTGRVWASASCSGRKAAYGHAQETPNRCVSRRTRRLSDICVPSLGRRRSAPLLAIAIETHQTKRAAGLPAQNHVRKVDNHRGSPTLTDHVCN